MTHIRSLALVCAVFFLCALCAHAARAADTTLYDNGNSRWQMKQDWQRNPYAPKPPAPNMQDARVRTCKQTADCAAANPPCGHLVAVNKQSLSLVQNWYDYVGAQMNCLARPDDSALSPVCRNSVCVMAAPGLGVPDKNNPAYCQDDTDCVAVTDVCKRISAVNAQHAQHTQAAFDAQNPAQCQWMDTTYLTGVSCVDHLCKARVSDYKPQ